MKIENLNEELVSFINEYFPNLNWEGHDTSAAADLTLDSDNCIDSNLMESIAQAAIATRLEEFTLTIRPKENKLILYYID